MSVSGLLERYAQQKEVPTGFELEDYFIRWDLEFGRSITLEAQGRISVSDLMQGKV